MESYIVRIYRRRATDQQPEHGVVERVAGGPRHAFSSADELWALLADAPRVRGTAAGTTNSTRRKK
jgi:hypothetical protein